MVQRIVHTLVPLNAGCIHGLRWENTVFFLLDHSRYLWTGQIQRWSLGLDVSQVYALQVLKYDFKYSFG